jgi:hypothetical protein
MLLSLVCHSPCFVNYALHNVLHLFIHLNEIVSGNDGSKLTLEVVDFAWAVAPLPSLSGDYRNGQKGAIVEMFGWPHKVYHITHSVISSDYVFGIS